MKSWLIVIALFSSTSAFAIGADSEPLFEVKAKVENLSDSTVRTERAENHKSQTHHLVAAAGAGFSSFVGLASMFVLWSGVTMLAEGTSLYDNAGSAFAFTIGSQLACVALYASVVTLGSSLFTSGGLVFGLATASISVLASMLGTIVGAFIGAFTADTSHRSLQNFLEGVVDGALIGGGLTALVSAAVVGGGLQYLQSEGLTDVE